MPDEATVQRGLEDVIALESRICFIDGRGGRLLYQGYDIRDLAASSTFEEVAYLLWYGQLPTERQLSDLRRRLASLRDLPPAVLEILGPIPPGSHPLDVLRTAGSALARFAAAHS